MGHRQRRACIAVYPGSFDPPTNGHLDIVRRAARLFDQLVVVVHALPTKQPLFSVGERVGLWQEVLASASLFNVRVEPSKELTVECVRSLGGQVIIKGLRSPHDFEAELKQGLMNRKLAPEIETVCLLTNLPQLFVTSSLAKEVVKLEGLAGDLLPEPVQQALQRKFACQRSCG